MNQDMLDLAIAEVQAIVQVHGNGVPAWRIQNGADAWEVLIGYTTNPALRAWMQSSAEFEAYELFIVRWNAMQGCRYCSRNESLQVCSICGCLCCPEHVWKMRAEVKERFNWAEGMECQECVCK